MNFYRQQEEWEAQAERLRSCKTEVARIVAIRKLLLSTEEIGLPARRLIAEYFPGGRPKKPGSGLIAVIACAFQMDAYPPKSRDARKRLIADVCGAIKCSREEFREHEHLLKSPGFRAGIRGERFPEDPS